jgi:hypothetical protein
MSSGSGSDEPRQTSTHVAGDCTVPSEQLGGCNLGAAQRGGGQIVDFRRDGVVLDQAAVALLILDLRRVSATSFGSRLSNE